MLTDRREGHGQAKGGYRSESCGRCDCSSKDAGFRFWCPTWLLSTRLLQKQKSCSCHLLKPLLVGVLRDFAKMCKGETERRDRDKTLPEIKDVAASLNVLLLFDY
jgi:hypothetical protein